MTKINIISGFLGAGKTTLITKLRGGAFGSEKVVLLENEYGEVGVDGGFMRDSGIQVTELNSGCICCTLVGDFSRALDELIDTGGALLGVGAALLLLWIIRRWKRARSG